MKPLEHLQKLPETAEKLPGLVKTGVSKGLETLLNQLVHLDEDQGLAFAPLDEKVVQLTLRDFKQTFFIIYQIADGETQGVFSVQTHLLGAADAHVTLTIDALLNQQAADKITGDAALGQTLLDALYDMEIDWEEHLSHYTGDLIAFKVGHAVRSSAEASQQAKQKIGETFKEYLQFEVNLLPTAAQVNAFSRKVQATESAVDALDARIQALLSSRSQ